MTDNFLQKLEEKVVALLTELESLRIELHQLRHENAQLKTEKISNMKKIQDVIALLDSLAVSEENSPMMGELHMVEERAEVAAV